MITSLEKQTYSNFNIIMVDDKSTDHTLNKMHAIAQWYPNTKVIAQPQNKGKVFALNIALKQSNAKYILCVNADAIFSPMPLNI